MSIRKLGVLLAIICASALAAPVAASAATTTHGTSFKNIPVSGTTKGGSAFKGRLTVTQFVRKAGKTVALGTMTGRVGNKTVHATQVALPVTMPKAGAASTAATCPILHLDLGPLTLNLLGLNVHLNEVVLDITATNGPGNLLGNLLCSVSNLLNNQTGLGAQLAGLLNIVEQLVNNPALLNI